MTELLAPGGSLEALKAAVNAGADAIYMGGAKFGARAYADNPDEDHLLEAIEYCHLRGKKLYLTVNTLLKEKELEEALVSYLKPYYEAGLDGVLVQDLGVLSVIRRVYPELPLHISTQMSLCTPEGAALAKELGAVRIVPAREISLDEIKAIREKVDIEIESFVHGALCYCYSGQCLMSSMIGGRSGNRGRCAQPCRMTYNVAENGKTMNGESDRYLMSLKDACTLESLPDMIDAGIASFKIEGRMKRPEYAAGVTMIYRKYMDLYAAKGRKGYKVDPEDMRILMDLYNRGGFSEGYNKKRNGKDMMTLNRPNHAGTAAAKVTQIRGGSGEAILTAVEDLYPGDALEIGEGAGNKGQELVLREACRKGDSIKVKAPARLIRKGQTLRRVRSEALLEQIRGVIAGAAKLKINGIFRISEGKPAILTVTYGPHRIAVEGPEATAAQNRPVTEADLEKQLRKTGDTPYEFGDLKVFAGDNLFYPLRTVNELRRSALEQLTEAILGAERRDPVAEAAQPAAENRKNTGATLYTAAVSTNDQLKAVLGCDWITEVQVDALSFVERTFTHTIGKSQAERRAAFADTAQRIHDAGKTCLLRFPPMWRGFMKKALLDVFDESSFAVCDGAVVRNTEQIPEAAAWFKGKTIVSDSSVYTWNKEAVRAVEALGITRTEVPAELNRRELGERGLAGSEMTVYGRTLLMITANCLRKSTTGCTHIPGQLVMTDRKNADFPVVCHCGICTNFIYNSLPLNLLPVYGQVQDLEPAAVRFDFTIETGAETEAVLRQAQLTVSGHAGASEEAGTRGHFKRGVE